MIFNKKAQGLSMTTIVVAALALLILIVLILIFTGRMSLFSDSVNKCDLESQKSPTMCTNNVPLKIVKEGSGEDQKIIYCCAEGTKPN